MQRISLAIACLAISASAQKFEVASIKPNKENDHRIMFGMQPGGRFSATGVTLKRLMVFAYGVREYQLTGLPAWADTDRYDISAKAEGAADAAPQDRPPTPAEMQTRQEKTRAMLQDLLADRFGLVMHRETKELPVYNLVVGKNGPKLVETPADPPSGSGDAPIRVGGLTVAPGAGQGARAQMISIGRGQISGSRMAMPMLVNQLSANLGRNVIDKTGLTGLYDIKLTWTPEEGQTMMPPPGANPGEGRPDSAPLDSGPSMFTAIQEQLGLKLEPGKGPVEMIVVDKADKPTEN